VLIRIWIEGTQPLAGTAATKGSKPLPFDGWLELLRVVSELLAAAEQPMQQGQHGDDSRHRGSPAAD
jgi:hypothetical protein